MVWDDLVRGRQHVDAASLSDPVLVRADGTYLYTMPSVVDDIDLGITHVIRGEDHVTNTAPQIQLFEALGAEPPAFGHHNLLVGADGQALSKRDRTLSIAALREEGIEALAVASYSAMIGTSDPVAPHANLDELARAFDFAKLSRAPARFDPHELRLLNAKLLHMLPFSAVAERLAAMGVGGGEEFWEAVRGNLAVLGEAKHWWRVVEGPLEPVIENAELCRAAVRPASARALGRGDLVGMVCGRQAGDRRQGQGAVPAAPSRAHRRASMDPSSSAAAIDRPRTRSGAARRQDRLRLKLLRGWGDRRLGRLLDDGRLPLLRRWRRRG